MSTQRRLTDAGRQMREYERGLIQIITEEQPTVDEAIEWSGYDWAELKAMAERAGVAL